MLYTAYVCVRLCVYVGISIKANPNILLFQQCKFVWRLFWWYYRRMNAFCHVLLFDWWSSIKVRDSYNLYPQRDRSQRSSQCVIQESSQLIISTHVNRLCERTLRLFRIISIGFSSKPRWPWSLVAVTFKHVFVRWVKFHRFYKCSLTCHMRTHFRLKYEYVEFVFTWFVDRPPTTATTQPITLEYSRNTMHSRTNAPSKCWTHGSVTSRASDASRRHGARCVAG